MISINSRTAAGRRSAGRRPSPFLLYMSCLFLCSAFLALSVLPFALDLAEGAEAVAKFTLLEGKVDVLSAGALPAVSVKVGDNLFVRDVIRTKSGSRAEIRFVDGTILKVAQRSRLDISEYVSEDARGKRTINLPRGKVEAVVPPKLTKQLEAAPKENRFEIHTPNAVAGVRGTDYIVFFESDITWVLVKEGIVSIFNPLLPDQVIMVAAGELSTVPMDRPPTKKEATEGEIQRMEQSAGPGNAGFALSGPQSYSAGYVTIDTIIATQPPPPSQTPPPPPQTPPAFEVGRTTLSGALVAGPAGQFDFISVLAKDVVFLAPSTGQAPTLWNTNNISGSYSFGPNIVNGVVTVPVSNGRGITGNFNVSQWGSNNWSGAMNGHGDLSGGPYTGPVNFQGSVRGTHTGGASGSFAGTGSGTASK